MRPTRTRAFCSPPFAQGRSTLQQTAHTRLVSSTVAQQGILRNRITLTEDVASEDDLGRFQSLHEKFDKYSPGNVAFTPEAAAKNVLTAVERSSLENGNGGGFLSHNGTQRWM